MTMLLTEVSTTRNHIMAIFNVPGAFVAKKYYTQKVVLLDEKVID
jgi:hypothetical protein